MPVRLSTYHRGESIPALPGVAIFHSTELFHVFEMTRGYDPILIVAYVGERPVAKLLAVVRQSVRWFPPAIIKRCEVYGTGEYFDWTPEETATRPETVQQSERLSQERLNQERLSQEKLNQEALFGEMLEHLTHEALRYCFLIEFRNLENALFGYRIFRHNHYFAVNWLRVHNSLHSKTPYERLSLSRRRQINKALKNGAIMQVADKEEDIKEFSVMLKKAYSSQIRKHFPDVDFFRLLAWQNPEKEMAKVFLVKYKDKIIGGSICLFSGDNAYLWFSGGMRKTYALLYPGVLAVWAPLVYAYEKGYRHLEFMDAGLPFKQYGYRDFILRFGGKQSSTRRWFRFRWGWLNALLERFYI